MGPARRKSFHAGQRSLRPLGSPLAIFLACAALASLPVTAQPLALQSTASAAPETTAPISGVVLDDHGKAVAGATVTLEPHDNSQPQANQTQTTQTDAAGQFHFAHAPATASTLRAIKAGIGSQEASLSPNAATHPPQRLVLQKTALAAQKSAPGILDSQASELSDKPDFTVAGVTDWTAVGGHGSDAVLRTSESLTRDTVALESSVTPAASRQPSGATEASLQQAVAASPTSYQANRDLGLFYLRAHRCAAAIPPLRAASAAQGGKPEDEYELALAYQGAGQPAEARDHIDRALQLDQSRADLHHLAAQIDEQLGDPLTAVKEQQTATRLEPSEENYIDLGSEFLLHRAIWQADETFAAGAKLYPDSARLHSAWGAALFAGARYDQAASQLCRASDLDPKNQQPYLALGKIAVVATVTDACVQQKLERFATLYPKNSQADFFLAMLLTKNGDPASNSRAQTLLEQAVALNPSDAEAYLQLGILAFAHHNYDLAITNYKNALRADDNLGEAHYRLAVVYDRTGKSDLAKTEFARHDEIEQRQAEEIEQQRRQIKQFVVATQSPP